MHAAPLAGALGALVEQQIGATRNGCFARRAAHVAVVPLVVDRVADRGRVVAGIGRGTRRAGAATRR